MKEKEFKIEIPEGYEIDKEKSSFKEIIFKKIEIKLPKTWEEFCEQNSVNNPEYYIMGYTSVFPRNRDYFVDKTLLSTKENAEAHLALIQLHRLRDVYRQGWTRYPDGHCYTIIVERDTLYVSDCYQQRFLSFQSLEIAEEFLKNFRALIETAKDLI
jgi:hypothetical protein